MSVGHGLALALVPPVNVLRTTFGILGGAIYVLELMELDPAARIGLCAATSTPFCGGIARVVSPETRRG